MRKKCYIIIIIIAFITDINARDISILEAEKAAITFYYEIFPGVELDDGGPFSSKYGISEHSPGPDYFVFNIKNQQGFILISASDHLPPVLGFSYQGSYPKDHKNKAFGFWLENVVKHKVSPDNVNNNKNKWNEYLAADVKSPSEIKAVDPLLTIAWGQGCDFNADCPADPSGSCGHAPTGCGATAMAMVLKYWNFPEHGIGSNAYECPPYGMLSADFESTYYDWENMPPQLNSESTSDEIDAVAELMSHSGIAVNMVYTSSTSYSDNWNIRHAMIDHFNYSSESQFVDKTDFTISEWVNLMQEEVDNGRPVFYGISSGTNGHFVVMDGYQDDEYFHYNWGYGNLNGYYKTFDELPVIQQAIIGVEPNSEKLAGSKDFYAYNGVFNDGSNNQPYANNKTYQWLIRPENALSVVILFTKFDTEYQSDFVNIYDGETTDAPLLGSFSGHNLPPVLQSSGNKVLIEFITNELISDEGWTLRYTSLRNELACSGISVLTESDGSVDDGSGTSSYIDNADCFWLIKPEQASSINLHFNDFNTETDWDFLYVYNGENPSPENLLAKLTGNTIPPDISSTEGAMLLHFHSDWNTSYPGWEVDYSANYEKINLDVKVLLEGPFLSNAMNPELSAVLPDSQPFDKIPSAQGYYEGDESVEEIPNPDIVDWMLVELRDTTLAEFASSETTIAQQAAFLLSDGSIVGLDGSSKVQFNNRFKYNLFVALYSRNHLAILSADPLIKSEGIYNYDFSTGAGQAFDGGQKEITTGVWGMLTGDIYPDGIVDSDDHLFWESEAGQSGYLQSDLNLQGQADNVDKDDFWLPNLGMGSKVPN